MPNSPSPPNISNLSLLSNSPSPPSIHPHPPRFRPDDNIDLPPTRSYGLPTPPPANPMNNMYSYQLPQHQQPQQQFNPLSNLAYIPNPNAGPYTPLSAKKQPARAGLPAQWLDPSPDSRSLSPPTASLPSSASTGASGQAELFDLSSNGGSPPRLNGLQPPLMQQQNGSAQLVGDDDIIPTAIVIKNIPFNVKRETLLDIITSLAIPTPYAFNYHLDALGAFRGLAFANFRQAADADAVVAALNGFDVQGRKLRVEYKKVLQAGEKERIEREKALRRMRSMGFDRPSASQQQINMPVPVPASPWSSPDAIGVQDPISSLAVSPPPGLMSNLANGLYSTHQMPMPQLQLPTGISSGMSNSASMPLSAVSPPPVSSTSSKNELDLNDPSTLDIYSRILVFKEDRMRDELAFSRSLTPRQRRTVHLVAQKLGVYHYSIGEGDERYAVVTRDPPEGRARHAGPTRTSSHSYLTPTVSPAPSLSSLRLKKSMPSLRPSPSSSHASPSPFLAPSLAQGAASASATLVLRRSNSNLHPTPHHLGQAPFATISTSTPPRPRGIGSDFGSLFGNPILPPIPPVPPLPAGITGSGSLNSGLNNVASSNGANDSQSGLAGSPSASVVRQPRGPTAGAGSGFLGRSRVISGNVAPSSASSGPTNGSAQPVNGSGALEATTHQPLEI